MRSQTSLASKPIIVWSCSNDICELRQKCLHKPNLVGAKLQARPAGQLRHTPIFSVINFDRVFHYTKISLNCQERWAKILFKIFLGDIVQSSFAKGGKTIDFTLGI